MSIKTVAMYRVECDVCGDGNDGEYWAWNGKDHAADEWMDGDDFLLDDGRAFHRKCVPFEHCPELDADEGHTWGLDGTCGEECGRNAGDVVAARTAGSAS